MRFRTHTVTCIACAAMLLSRAAGTPQPAPDKNVWNYEGGVSLITNGSIPNGPCFRITGKVTGAGFFDHLKRVDTDNGAVFKRGNEVVSQFPEQVLLSFSVRDHYDQTCPPQVENAGSSPYLTRAMMSSLTLFLYWKHGVELRPISNVEPKFFSVDPIIPYAAAKAQNLPPKFQWSYEYAVPSAGVPVTDSLVLVLRTQDGRIAARVAARL